MTTTSEYFENLLEECGGLSRFQAILLITVYGSKLSVTWSMLMMTFAGAIPDWYCDYEYANSTGTANQSINFNHALKQCHPDNVTSCQTITYDDNMNTVVNEWSLICSKDWISSTITTIQMGGILVSGFIVGQLADHFGRKPVYFLSLALFVVLNVVAGFSTSWQMFAVLRFFLGFASGCYLIVYFNLLIEFCPRKYRPLMISIPSWAFWAAVFGLVSMWIHDWQYLHFATAICTAPFLLTWSVTPESFRWLLAHNKIDEAKKIITKIATRNRRQVPDLSKLKMFVDELQVKTSHVYSIKDLFSNTDLIRSTGLMAIGWFSCSFAYYGISFGVQSLSGSLYINMFLLSIVEFPGGVIIYFLANRIGRRPTILICLAIAGISGLAVGFIQRSDLEMKASLINGLALTSKLGVSAGWGALMLFTTESYPTVVRNIGYGLQNSFARVGSMLAPQVVFLNDKVTGLLYFLCGGCMILTWFCTLFFQETKGKAMLDTITIKSEQEDSDWKMKDVNSANTHVDKQFDSCNSKL